MSDGLIGRLIGPQRGGFAFDNVGSVVANSNPITLPWAGGVAPRDGALIVAMTATMTQFFGQSSTITPPASWGAALDFSTFGPPPFAAATTYSWTASGEPTSYLLVGHGGNAYAAVVMAFDNAILHEHGIACDRTAPPWAVPSLVTAQPSYTLVGMWAFFGDQNTPGSGSLGTLPATTRTRSTLALVDAGASSETASGTPSPTGYSASGPATTTEAIARAAFVLTH